MKVARKAPWEFDPHTLGMHGIQAIKALAATQPAAWDAIMKLCDLGGTTFVPGGDDGRRATDFAEGRRWVAVTLRVIRDMKMPGPATPSSRQGPPEMPRPVETSEQT